MNEPVYLTWQILNRGLIKGKYITWEHTEKYIENQERIFNHH